MGERPDLPLYDAADFDDYKGRFPGASLDAWKTRAADDAAAPEARPEVTHEVSEYELAGLHWRARHLARGVDEALTALATGNVGAARKALLDAKRRAKR